MGLDARDYCNCYETGKVKAPPQPKLAYADSETGQVPLRWDAPGANELLFYDWLASAWLHGPSGQLVAHYLGNIALIALLRELFEETPDRFPILLTKVVYNGIHRGDILSLADVEDLDGEMRQSKAFTLRIRSENVFCGILNPNDGADRLLIPPAFAKRSRTKDGLERGKLANPVYQMNRRTLRGLFHP